MSGAAIRQLRPDELGEDLLDGFAHRQRVAAVWVRQGGGYVLRPADLVREWSGEKRRWIPSWLREQAERGGAVFGAYDGNKLAGFASVDGALSDGPVRYANLTMLFVDDGLQRRGIGSLLFRAVCLRAKETGADRLFISAVPSVETTAFYFRMGCRDAERVPPSFADTEEDRFLECLL